MKNESKYAGVLLELYEELLDEEDLETALAGSLELLVHALKCEAGVIWLLDQKTNRLIPMFHMGPVDLSNISIVISLPSVHAIQSGLFPCALSVHSSAHQLQNKGDSPISATPLLY